LITNLLNIHKIDYPEKQKGIDKQLEHLVVNCQLTKAAQLFEMFKSTTLNIQQRCDSCAKQCELILSLQNGSFKCDPEFQKQLLNHQLTKQDIDADPTWVDNAVILVLVILNLLFFDLSYIM
jgi:hypothetical protein